jgi:hypothetical protein
LDERTAGVIEAALVADSDIEGATRRVLLLAPPGHPATLVFDNVIENDKTIKDKPVVWTLGPKVVPLAALSRRPSTTSELDAILAGMGEP